ncbi:hypothetical protein OCA22_28980 [Bacillus cereus]|nr:hypothetical protein [Bacillus cereus]
MTGVIIGTVLLLALFGGMGWAVMYQLKKTDPKQADTSTREDIQNAQDFLPYKDITDSMIDLGQHHYRAIIECNSINYDLKTEKEKEIIDLSFQRFLNSLSHPITFFVHTRTIDNAKTLKLLEDDILTTIKDYPNLESYGDAYYSEMANLPTIIGNNKQKKKYIIVPYMEANELTTATDEEKYDYSAKELYTRCQMLIDGLAGIGVKGNILETNEVAEVIFGVYHRQNHSHAEGVVSGEYLNLMVEGKKNPLQEVLPEGKLDWILYESQIRLEKELLESNGVDADVKGSANKAIQEINKIREAVAGYYKTPSVEIPNIPEMEADKDVIL